MFLLHVHGACSLQAHTLATRYSLARLIHKCGFESVLLLLTSIKARIMCNLHGTHVLKMQLNKRISTNSATERKEHTNRCDVALVGF